MFQGEMLHRRNICDYVVQRDVKYVFMDIFLF